MFDDILYLESKKRKATTQAGAGDAKIIKNGKLIELDSY